MSEGIHCLTQSALLDSRKKQEVLLVLLRLQLLSDVLLANRLHHSLVDLTVFIDSRIVDTINPSLVEQNDEDGIVSEACKAVEARESDTAMLGGEMTLPVKPRHANAEGLIRHQLRAASTESRTTKN